MYQDIRQQFFPMKLPSGVVGRWMDEEAAQEPISAFGRQIFAPRHEHGLFLVPEARREKLDRLRELHAYSCPEWVVFYSEQDEPIGWFFGYMEDDMTFFIDTIGLVPAFRGRGIYSAFLKQLIAYLGALGYERITTTHHPNNRAVMIAELKAGFNIVGLEIHESFGPMVKMACPLHDDRREGFRQVFSMAPDPASDVG